MPALVAEEGRIVNRIPGRSAARAILLACFAALPSVARPTQDPAADLQKKANDYRRHVREIRGLEFKSDVKVGVYSRQEILDFVTTELERELPKEKALKYQTAYAHFGLIPKDLDLYDALLELIGSSISGFYHPRTKEMRLVRARGGGMDFQENITLVHELTHAAQDQNFDLTTLPLEDETNNDLVLALKALIEGDACIVGCQYAFRDTFKPTIESFNARFKQGKLPGAAGKLPAYLRRMLTFPYGHGTEFCGAVKAAAREEFSAISKAFEDLPSSTEQILHPEKYHVKRDCPQVLTLPDLAGTLGRGWTLLVDNVHGEFGMRLLLEGLGPGNQTLKEIESACEGWDGDRFHVLEKGGRASSAWISTWDTEEDARAFFDAYRKALGSKHPEATWDDAEKLSRTSEGEIRIRLERRGPDILVLEGDAAVVALADPIWKDARRNELQKVDRVKPKK